MREEIEDNSFSRVNEKSILNKARQSLPLEHSIWIHAAMLEES